MGSRLERLVLLLETGATPSVRLTAARQLGAIAGSRVSHPTQRTQTNLGEQDDAQLIWRGIEGEWNQVIALVAKVLPHLQSRSFETRQAAAAALAAISRAVGIWDPTDFSLASDPTAEDSKPILPNPEQQLLDLDTFNLAKVLADGTLLLSSSGDEYARLNNLSAEELARAQKDALGKLGLGIGAGSAGVADEIGIDMEAELASGVDQGIVADVKPAGIHALPPPKFKADLSQSLGKFDFPSTTAPSSTKSTTTKIKIPVPPIASTSMSASPSTSAPPLDGEEALFAGMSARERNKLKRKRKSEAKSGAPMGMSSAGSSSKVRVVEAPDAAPIPISKAKVAKGNGKKEVKYADDEEESVGVGLAGEAVVIDPGAKAREREGGEVAIDTAAETRSEFEVREGEWPWRGTVERLSVGLLSPKWETRHGAALGLKEILKLQAGGGGQFAGATLTANENAHKNWCDDLATKLLCVFALDRFGDYVSDQVVAPVRETAAQALATLLPQMPLSSVSSVQRILIDMVEQGGAPPSRGLDGARADSKMVAARIAKDATVGERGKYVWQVRHAGLLGLKYLVAVKGDLLKDGEVRIESEMELDDKPIRGHRLLKGVVDAALLGLRDQDDDVRSAAAATLTPIADSLVDRLPAELNTLVTVLWECLADLKDDLSSSIGGVMDLLAKLLSFSAVLDIMQSPSIEKPLSDLIPLLFPFFRHTIPTVRLAVVNTILVFLALPTIDHSWADSRLLRLLFQNLVVEDRLDVRLATSQAWHECLRLGRADPAELTRNAIPYLKIWFRILTNPIGVALDPTWFWSARMSYGGQAGFIHNVDKAMLAQDLSLVSVEAIMTGRIAGAVAMGELIASWSIGTHDSAFGQILVDGLSSTSALGRIMAASIIEEWSTAHHTTRDAQPLVQKSTLASRLSKQLLSLIAAEPPALYSEMTTILPRIKQDCQALYVAFESAGKVPAGNVPQLSGSFNLIQAQQAVGGFDRLLALVDRETRKDALSLLEERKRKLVVAISYFEGTKQKHDRQVFAAIGGAVVALRFIPSKVTPVIRSFTNSIKTEDDVELQSRSARSIALFIELCSSPTSTLKTNPSDKIVKNLCTFLCQDVSKTPIFAKARLSTAGILTLEYNPARGLATKETKESQAQSEEVLATKLVYRGAKLALEELGKRFGESLLASVPKLWSCMSESLLTIYASGDISIADGILSDELQGQDLLDCLTVLPIAAQTLGSTALRDRLVTLFPALALATQSKFAVVRYAVARCFAALCDVVPLEGLRHVVESVIPILGDPLNLDNRRGAIELVSHIVELLDVKILPYVIFLVVPVLGRMSDSDDEVRLVATNTFATLIKLVPLEAGLPAPPGFSQELLEKRISERVFLAQLLDGSKVEEYKIPIPISIELRKYQRDGVSWLAFLAKYQLHGLLCDDMGLGKTLQSICILGSKHHERAEIQKATKSPDSVHLPSLVICPPTLTGHWTQEITTYATNLRPVTYTGSKGEREKLIKSIKNYDVVITSYEVVRNDIEILGKVDWMYCILDEGHIIKNGKTKLTRAVKQLKSIHRLILSGTPIQNNVLELWSLFDFLMPGFLGSEKAFNHRFGKPIASSRDAKSSSKEQAAGALALEALHKQVLPFLLRRLKEDVLDDLPPKIIQDYYCELSPLQKQLYDDFSNSQARHDVDDQVSGAGAPAKGQHVFQALQYLRKLVNHPVLILKPELPQHQAVITKLESSGSTLRDIAHAPKLQALRQILLDCGIGTPPSDDDTGVEAVSQHRVLIFCQLKQMLDLIENDLFRPHMPSVTYMRMDGTTDPSKRHGVVQTFNADPSIDCLLLTTHVGGLGLNLTGADTVIFIEHDWNPMKDLQAMDRAHRLGQKKVVNVYRLIMRGTLEEKIMGLQRFKLNIASSVVTQQNSELSSLGTDQILDLFNVSSTGAILVESQTRAVGQKAILEGLGDLPPEEEYGELDLGAFSSSLGV